MPKKIYGLVHKLVCERDHFFVRMILADGSYTCWEAKNELEKAAKKIADKR